MKKIYIAGKITDCPDYKQHFERAEAILRAEGYKVINPAHLDLAMPGFEHADYMHVCRAMIDLVDCVAFLPNWRDSLGATMEYKYARKKRKKRIYLGAACSIAEKNKDFGGCKQ